VSVRLTTAVTNHEARPVPARLTVLSGPSGVGKDSVIELIRARSPWVWLSVSVTTRRIRPYETEGKHYHFVDRVEFEHLVRRGALLEWAEFAGNLYGTPRAPVEARLAAGIPALLKIDLQGARQVRDAMPSARLVFLAPPSWDELKRRLVGRGTDDATTIARRLEHAREELAAEPEFDITVVNDSVERAADELVRLLGSAGPSLSNGDPAHYDAFHHGLFALDGAYAHHES
jgi:guanylate kinase